MTEYNKTEKQIILDVAKSLSVSSVRPFSTGDVTEWHDYASKMKNVIDTVIPILTTLGNKGIEEVIDQTGIEAYKAYLDRNLKEYASYLDNTLDDTFTESVNTDRIGTKLNQNEESL
jgi:hypothetical protein